MNMQQVDKKINAQALESIDELLSELTHYKQQSDRLQKVNELYQRMAGILDLPAMIETYSVWLTQYVAHELIGYNNLTNQRMHMYCSSHGPHRRLVINIAEKILKEKSPGIVNRAVDGFSAHKWSFETAESHGILVLLHKERPISAEDLDLINDSLTILAEPLKRAIDYEEVVEQARRDTLTGLPNRLVFGERIDLIIEQAKRHNNPVTLAALDLDHFKEVNDSMGHNIGDKVLKKVADTLQEQIRQTDLLARMGGDEFLLILPDTGMPAARILAERLVQAVSDLDVYTEKGKLGVSIGLAEWNRELTKKQWLEKADDILYQAKAEGRSRVAQ